MEQLPCAVQHVTAQVQLCNSLQVLGEQHVEGRDSGCGLWVEQSKQYIEGEGQWVGMVGGAIKAVYRRGGTVGGDGGWSNQSSI